MGIASASLGTGIGSGFQIIVAPLQALVSFFAPWQAAQTASGNTPIATKSVAPEQAFTLAPRHKASQKHATDSIVRTPVAGRALRVLRVQDASAPRCSAGRMVISGRMADVCAELERLAQIEAAPIR